MWPRPAPPRAVSHGPSRAPQRHPACVYTQTGRNSGQQDQSAYFSVVRRLWNDPKMIQKCSKLRNWVHKCRYREQITYVSCGLLTWIMSRMFVISVYIWLHGFMTVTPVRQLSLQWLSRVWNCDWIPVILLVMSPSGAVTSAATRSVPTATPPEAHITSSSSIITGARTTHLPGALACVQWNWNTTVALCHRCGYLCGYLCRYLDTYGVDISDIYGVDISRYLWCLGLCSETQQLPVAALLSLLCRYLWCRYIKISMV